MTDRFSKLNRDANNIRDRLQVVEENRSNL